jgi:hypothetical protein
VTDYRLWMLRYPVIGSSEGGAVLYEPTLRNGPAAGKLKRKSHMDYPGLFLPR